MADATKGEASWLFSIRISQPGMVSSASAPMGPRHQLPKVLTTDNSGLEMDIGPSGISLETPETGTRFTPRVEIDFRIGATDSRENLLLVNHLPPSAPTCLQVMKKQLLSGSSWKAPLLCWIPKLSVEVFSEGSLENRPA